MLEYPKRLYKNGVGHTVYSLKEEQAFLNSSIEEELLPVTEESVGETGMEEESVDETEAEATGTEEEALEYIVSKGYNKKSARTILKKQGLESILKHKAEETDPQE